MYVIILIHRFCYFPAKQGSRYGKTAPIFVSLTAV